ncbi:MAG TPA: hypothetical protein VF407_16655, partial [Polyangiaceae bacterium]
MKTSSLLFLFGIGIASVAAAACSASGASGVEGGDDDSTGATDAGQRTDANYYGDQDSGGDDDEGGSSSCGATNTIENCGECGNKCPGANADGGSAAGSNVTCGSDGGTSTCGFSCSGERYDVNGDAGDGCEVADSPFGNHTTTGPTALGTYGCDDGDSAQDFGGKLPSDQ